MKYYAFEWSISVGYKHTDGSLAGLLYAFETTSQRDKWVDAGPDFEHFFYRQVVTKKWVEKYAKDYYPLTAS